MKCHYCATYATTPQSLRKMVSNPPKPKISHRYCRHIHKDVTSVTDSCIDLTPAPYTSGVRSGAVGFMSLCVLSEERGKYSHVYGASSTERLRT